VRGYYEKDSKGLRVILWKFLH